MCVYTHTHTHTHTHIHMYKFQKLLYLDVLSTISDIQMKNITYKIILHQKIQMAQIVRNCAKMVILETSPDMPVLKPL